MTGSSAASSVSPTCPQCGSSEVARIQWGYPALSDELEADVEAGRVVLGGCLVGPDDATHQCRACGWTFGGREAPEPEDWEVWADEDEEAGEL